MTEPTEPRRGRKGKPRIDIPSKVTKAQLEALTGYSAKQITRFVQTTDIPNERVGNELYFPWPQTRSWLNRYLEDKGKRAADPAVKDNPRQREDYARAELLEIDLAKARNAVMPVDHFVRLVTGSFGRVRAKLANLAPRAAAAGFGAETLQDAQARIQPVVDEIFDELRQTDDIPPTLDEPDDPGSAGGD